jgi:hypothetical protein
MEPIIFDIFPNDLLFNIYKYLNIVYIHVTRFVCKKSHDSIRSFIASGLIKGQKCTENLDIEAAKLGNAKIFEWIISIFGKSSDYNFYDFAARYGSLDLLKYLFKSGYPLYPLICIDPTFVVENGNLDIVKWFIIENFFPFTMEMYSKAASKNHVDIIKWAKKRGYSWNQGACYDAARGGHLELLKWLRKKKCPWSELTCIAAASTGQLDILKWLRENGCPWNERTCSEAALGGHLEVLKWAKDNGCPWDKYTCCSAAMKGHLEILMWARGNENPCPWDKKTCSEAAFYGHLEILKWARENGCPWDEHICCCAALGGHLEVLRWARKNKCPWDERTCSYSAKRGHLEILKWARENGCEWDEDTCASAAGNEKFPDVTKWERMRATCQDKKILKIMHNKNLEVLKWARENGCPWDWKTCAYAATSGRLDALKWARENGCPWSEDVYHNALRHEHSDILEWLKSNGCSRSFRSYFEIHFETKIKSYFDLFIDKIYLYMFKWRIQNPNTFNNIDKTIQVFEVIIISLIYLLPLLILIYILY